MKTICYDIISFNRKKLELKKCPDCHSNLKTCDLDHSEASRVFCQKASMPVISTKLIECSDCGWWAVRELRLDNELYYPPVEEFIVMDASKIDSDKPGFRTVSKQDGPAPWEQVLTDKVYWGNCEIMSSRDAVELFGSAQMLLPKISGISGKGVVNRVKSFAPVLFPILVIILIGLIGMFL
ncbi:MAG: hypothetical protein Q9M08_08155 [Mariprofundus sp.]|nr:hypothetical protein [Mariprofundus sp.]